MILHVKLEDGDGDATTRAGMDVPDAFTIFRVFVRIAWAVEGTRRPEEFSTTTCRG